MNKNLITLILSLFFSLLLIYVVIFFKIYFEDQEKYTFLFKHKESLEFHIKYSKKIHHLRNSVDEWEIEGKPENFLFSSISKFSKNKKNILFQGDSWMEQINQEKESFAKIKEFSKKNNYGVINAGTTSFSPSPMMLQYEILENDFNIKPNIVIAYIDQGDIGDEICRYKEKRVLNKNNKLVSIKNEKYSRAIYDYSIIYPMSNIILSDSTKMVKKIKLTNSFIKYKIFRGIKKIQSFTKLGLKNIDSERCHFDQIMKYLINPSSNDKIYFKNRLKDYINLLKEKDYIEKIILVSFPHRNHKISENDKNFYSLNISNIIDNVLKNEEKIFHLNFSRLIDDKKIKFNQNFYIADDPASHLIGKYHQKIFLNTIINFINSHE